jgi:hypothetical protein
MNASYRMGDIGMAAFAAFFMQSPSFLAHQRRLEHGHGQNAVPGVDRRYSGIQSPGHSDSGRFALPINDTI